MHDDELLTFIRVIERFYQEQWDRAIQLLNSAPHATQKASDDSET